MRRDRALYDYETYLRDGAGGVNIAVSGRAHQFPRARSGFYRSSSFSVVLAGQGLLSNFQQFGAGQGELQISLSKKDEFGVVWDRLATKRSVLGPGEWLCYARGMYFAESEHDAPRKGRMQKSGTLAPAFQRPFATLEPASIARLMNPGPAWGIGPIPLQGDLVSHVAWTLEDVVDETGIPIDCYRIDLILTDPVNPGAPPQAYCLTHWNNNVIPNPLPPPLYFPVDRTSVTPFGVKIPEVFELKSRDLSTLVGGQPQPIPALDASILISFDPADRRIARWLHRDDFYLKPPCFREVAIYSRFAPEQAGQGRRRPGRFTSLRELSEFCGGVEEASRVNAIGGNEDLVYLSLPLGGDFNASRSEGVVASFVPPAGANPLTMLEIRAEQGSIMHREG